MHPIIFPIDGKKDFNYFLKSFLEIFTQPLAADLTGFIKLNDANFYPDISAINAQKYLRTLISKYLPHAGIFLDLKIADTNGSDVNMLRHFKENGIAPDILTVRDNIGAKGYLLLKRLLPDTKLALVSVLTDIPEDEARRRYGMFPAVKIMNDIINIQAEYDTIREDEDPAQAFDMIVCSPHELKMLITVFPYQYQYICPGIRDEWMTKGQQARIMGVKEALDLGATYVVMGSQMTKGNPNEGISVAQSRQLTFERMKLARYSFFCPNDPIQMLYHCDGYYESPRDKCGKILGPLVAYAGRDNKGKNMVGYNYFNFAKAEENPLILSAFAALLAKKINETAGIPDALVGMPVGGQALAANTARFLGCRYVVAEKKVIALADPKQGKKETSELVIKRQEIRDGDRVVIIEDVCNNFSTTGKAHELIETMGAKLIAIGCAENRSEKTEWKGKPVAAVCHIESPQFTQNHPAVRILVETKNISWEPKHEWNRLKQAMENNR